MIVADLLPGARPRIAVDFEGVTDESSELLAEQVVGGRWRNTIRRWVYPGTADKCREMRQAWGSELKVTPELSEWYKALSKAQEGQTKAGTRADAVLERVPHVAPDLYASLAPDQRAGAAWIATAYRGAGIFAPEMGVGKTRTVIAGLIERGITGRILIVCPKISVNSVWGREFSRFTNIPVFLARGTRAQREKAIDEFFIHDSLVAKHNRPRVLVVVAEMLRIKAKLKNKKIALDEEGRSTFEGYQFPELFDKNRPWDAVVVDESHKLLASVTVTKGTLSGRGLKRIPQSAGPTCLRLAVSATPFGQGGEVKGMFGHLHWCWPNEYTSFWNFANENFVVEQRSIGRGRTVNKIGPLRVEGGVEGFFQSLGPRVFRRTLEEVSPEHAGRLHYWIQDCEMEPEQEAQYRSLSDNGEVMTSGGLLAAAGVLAELTRSRQLANGAVTVKEVKNGTAKVEFTGPSGKIEALLDNLEERGILDGTGRRKVVVASQFNEFLELVAEALDVEEVPYHYMTGATTERQRERMMDQFQGKGGPRVFLMNAKAGGVSITLDAADELHQLDEMYPPEANEQLHRRIFRRSRVHTAHIVYYRTIGTIDENVADRVGVKLMAQLKTLDGRRGREIVRKLIKLREGK